MTYIPSNDPWAEIFRGIGSGLTEGYMNRTDENTLKKAISSLSSDASPREILDVITNAKTYSPQAKQAALQNYLGVEGTQELRRKARETEELGKEKNAELKRHAQAQEEIAREKNRIMELGKAGPEDQDSLRDSYLASGMPDYEVDLMVNPNVTPATKQTIARQHADLSSRGIRTPLNPAAQNTPTAQQSQAGISTTQPGIENAPNSQQMHLQEELQESPIVEAVEQAVEAAKPAKEWPDIEPPAQTTPKEKESWREKNQTFNNKELKETREKLDTHRTNVVKYKHMENLNESDKIPSGVGRLVINPESGEPYAIASLAGIVNKETQDFVKTVNDFLSGAKDYFGGRVSNFEVNSFKSRLPTLMNTQEGRRLIIKQMQLMEELQIIRDKEFSDGLKHYGRNANYSDIANIVDEKVEQKEQAVIGKLNTLLQASDYLDKQANDPKLKDTVLMQDPSGKFKYVPQARVNDAKSKGYTRW